MLGGIRKKLGLGHIKEQLKPTFGMESLPAAKRDMDAEADYSEGSNWVDDADSKEIFQSEGAR